MTINEKEKIIELSNTGMSINKISKEMNLPFSTVRLFLENNRIAYFDKCLECGTKIPIIKDHRKRKFCSDKCRNKWWNQRKDLVNKQAYYLLVCKQCGKEFVSYGDKNQIFCSRKCLADYRRKR